MRRVLLLLICTLLLSSVSAQDQPKEKKQSKFGSNAAGVELMQIRNIPIKWKEVPTQNIVDESYALSAITDINIVSCVGDKATGNVL